MAEFPNFGQHCAVDLCNRLDFLPIKCDSCTRKFCTDHFTYEAHSCESSSHKNAQVPICPICSLPVPTPRGTPVDYQVNEHIQNNCSVNKTKIFTNKCNRAGCKKKELIPVTCTRCKRNFCLGHRHERDHDCEEFMKTAPHKKGGVFGFTLPAALGNCRSQVTRSQESQDEQLARALQEEEYSETPNRRNNSNSNCSKIIMPLNRRSPEQLVLLRKKGAPWTSAAVFVFLIFTLAAMFYLIYGRWIVIPNSERSEPIYDRSMRLLGKGGANGDRKNVNNQCGSHHGPKRTRVDGGRAIVLPNSEYSHFDHVVISTTSSSIPSDAKTTESTTLNFTTTTTARTSEADEQEKGASGSDVKTEKFQWPREIRSTVQELKNFAVLTNHEECSRISRDTLVRGGNAVDAAISAEFCLAAVHPHATGPGFGLVVTLHSEKDGKTYTIDGRERAPRTAVPHTFADNPNLAKLGYSSICTPGWVSVLWTLFRRFGSGRITWKDLVTPAARLILNDAVYVDHFLERAIREHHSTLKSEKSFRPILNSTTTSGSSIKDVALAELFHKLAVAPDPVELFYRGELADDVFMEMRKRGGLLRKSDFESYECVVSETVTVDIHYSQLRGPRFPSYFSLLKYFFRDIAEVYGISDELNNDPDFFESVLKALSHMQKIKKYVADDQVDKQVKRLIEMHRSGSPVEEEKKIETSSNVITIDNKGNVLSMASTSTNAFGSIRRSSKLGFVWNNAMSSFKTDCEKGVVNCILGGKRPAIHVSPFILFDEEDQPIMAFASTEGGLETTAQVILHHIILRKPIPAAIDMPKLFLMAPDVVKYESGVPQELLRSLREKYRTKIAEEHKAIYVLHRLTKNITEAICDFRQPNSCYPMGQ
ncbi:unnamed protein product [Caenorhabditis auriculariae]|uniref:AN1-type domain-containing protein n=1 Tax=Caenorhabditis auriculariae TaxID=2777116 RepID=A0A8S1HEV3_9PELO|nr:unnamed protein product [Caenorhabditis auriculariae]